MSVLRFSPAVTAGVLLVVGAMAFLAWWDRVPFDAGILRAFWVRDAKLLSVAWPGVLPVWAGNLGHLALLAAVEAACFLLGRRVLRWVLGGPGPGGVRAVIFALGIGHGLAGTATLGLGLCGLLGTGLFRSGLAACLLLAGDPRQWRWFRPDADSAGDGRGVLPEVETPSAGGRIVGTACAVVAAFCLAGLAAGFILLLRHGSSPDGMFTRTAPGGIVPFGLACAAVVGAAALALRFAGSPPRPLAWLLAGCAAFFAAVNLVPAFQPEWFYDSLVYHLAVPEQYLINHKVCYLGHTFISNYPFLQEMRYLACLALGDDILPKLLHWSDGVAAAAAAWALARPVAGPAGAWLAAALFLSSPALLFLQQVSMVELGLTWFGALAMMAFAAGMGWMPGVRRPRLAWLLLAGWYLGLAQGIKYVGLNLSVLILGALVLAPRRPGAPWTRTVRDVALIVGWASLWTGVWLAKNWAFTGNPLFPFFHRWLGGLNWDDSRQALWMADNMKYGTGHGSLLHWLTMPAMLFTDAPGFGSISLNPFPLLLLPAILLHRAPPAPIRFLAAFAALGFVLWATSAQEVRFLVPMLPPAAAAAAWAVVALGRGGGWVVRAEVAAAAGWILLSAMHGALVHRYGSDVLVPHALGTMSRREVLRSALTYYDAVTRANELVAPGNRILFVGADESFYCTRGRICDSIYDFSTLGRLALLSESPAGLAARLRRLRVTHLLVHERRCEEYVDYGLFAWPDRARRNVLGMWAAHLRPVFSARGVQLLELSRLPSPPALRKTGVPSWLHDTATVRRARDLSARIDALLVAGRTAEAYPPADEFVRAVPGAAQAYAYRGLVEAQLNRMREAERDDETAIRVGYPAAVAYVNLGILLAIRGEYARALAVLEEAIPLDPVFANAARENALKTAVALKRWDTALRMAEALAAARPGDAELSEQVARLKVLRATSRR